MYLVLTKETPSVETRTNQSPCRKTQLLRREFDFFSTSRLLLNRRERSSSHQCFRLSIRYFARRPTMARPAAALLLAALCLLQLCLLTRASASRRLLAADSTDAAADVDVELPKEKEALHHPNADGEVVGQAPADSTAAVDVRLQDLMSDDYPYQSAEAVAQAPVEDAAASAVDTTAAAADTVAADVASSGAASAQQITARYGLGCDDYNVGTYRNMAFQTWCAPLHRPCDTHSAHHSRHFLATLPTDGERKCDGAAELLNVAVELSPIPPCGD